MVTNMLKRKEQENLRDLTKDPEKPQEHKNWSPRKQFVLGSSLFVVVLVLWFAFKILINASSPTPI